MLQKRASRCRWLLACVLCVLASPPARGSDKTPEAADGATESYPISFSPAPEKPALNFSPKGTQVKLVPKKMAGLDGVDHLEGRLQLGPHRATGPGQLLVLARSREGTPYDMLFIDAGHDGSVADDAPLNTKPNTVRDNLWSSFSVKLMVNHASAGKAPEFEDYPVGLWVVVEKSDERPDIIRFSRRGHLTGAVTLGDMTFDVVLSDSNNDAVFGIRDWWGLRQQTGTRKADLDRAVGDYAWAGGKAWKLELDGTNGRAGKLISFDPGITEEEDIIRRDRLREDRLAVRAPKPVPFLADAEAAIKAATTDKKPYFLKFETEWCGPCKEMDALVFTAKDVVAVAERVVCIKIDGDKRKDLVEEHGVKGYPTGILFSGAGEEVARYSGYQSVKQTAAFFQKLAK